MGACRSKETAPGASLRPQTSPTPMSAKKPELPPLHASTAAGTLACERSALDGEIAGCIAMVRQIRGDYKGDGGVSAGLQGLEEQLLALRSSRGTEVELRKQLDTLMRVPLGPDMAPRLEAFRRSSAKATLGSEEE